VSSTVAWDLPSTRTSGQDDVNSKQTPSKYTCPADYHSVLVSCGIAWDPGTYIGDPPCLPKFLLASPASEGLWPTARVSNTQVFSFKHNLFCVWGWMGGGKEN